MMDSNMAQGEWNQRVDLALAYRIAAHFGWNQTIYNHFAVRVPGPGSQFLVKRHAQLFDEVTASSLVKVDTQGDALGFGDDVNPAAFSIHSAVLDSRPDLNASMHLHTVPGVAISAHPDGFKFISQESAFFFDRISYYEYGGIEENECEAIARAFQASHHTMIMRSHGVVTTGHTIRAALFRMYYLLLCSEQQLLIESTGAKPLLLEPELCARTLAQHERFVTESGFAAEWDGWRRMIDRVNPGYDQ